MPGSIIRTGVRLSLFLTTEGSQFLRKLAARQNTSRAYAGSFPTPGNRTLAEVGAHVGEGA